MDSLTLQPSLSTSRTHLQKIMICCTHSNGPHQAVDLKQQPDEAHYFVSAMALVKTVLLSENLFPYSFYNHVDNVLSNQILVWIFGHCPQETSLSMLRICSNLLNVSTSSRDWDEERITIALKTLRKMLLCLLLFKTLWEFKSFAWLCPRM